MGCSNASAATLIPLSASAVKEDARRPALFEPLTVKDLDKRTLAPPRANVSTSGSYTFSDAFVSQRGYDPDVCRDKVPDLLAENVKNSMPVSNALTLAPIDANSLIHSASFDDSMSGTTAISILFDGNEIHVSNVGDSRAIIAQEVSSDGNEAAQLL